MTRPLSDQDLAQIQAEWATQCGSCDAGLPMGCTCSQGDPRPVVARLLGEIDRLRTASGTEEEQ